MYQDKHYQHWKDVFFADHPGHTLFFFYCQDNKVFFISHIYFTEDRTGFGNSNVNIHFHLSASSQVFKTVLSGCLLYCSLGHNAFKVYSVNSLAMIPCFGSRVKHLQMLFYIPAQLTGKGWEKQFLCASDKLLN